MLAIDNAGLQKENSQLQAQRDADSAKIAADRTRITRLQGAIKYTIESDLLFETGSWEMSARGKQIIGKMAAKLAPTQENKLVVNGYADNQPIGPALEKKGVGSNQELSQRRAEAVKEFLVEQGVNPALIVAVGHGDANPVAENDTAKGRSQNRRVELTLGT